MNEEKEEGYDSDATVLMTEDPVLDMYTPSKELELGYDSDKTVVMQGYDSDETVVMTEDPLGEKYTTSEEPGLEREALKHELGEGTTVSKEDEC